ncbi:hypothetical protein NHX12_024637 [Muraenolepis orangiensis]|uniref:Uncharacterized protein n=1 Tax=Muraenolepis orangiensis TaxID=630683 RepID=A0A9Q0ISH7_9TELE|nr:hypothetical protein NHX12_024637 [Muraenolepis orangiensis]
METVSYELDINNRTYFLLLKQNRDFISDRFVQYSHHRGGYSKSTRANHVHCYYHGHVDGYEDSLVILSTCSGLRGVIVLRNESYGLEPVPLSPSNEHRLYPLEDATSRHTVCGVTNEEEDRAQVEHSPFDPSHTLTSLLRRRKRNLPQTSYVELVFVVDKLRYELMGRNETAVTEEMVEMANLLDGYYKRLNIRVALVGLEIFKDANPFDVELTASKVLKQFVDWRKTKLLPRVQHDDAQLIVGLPAPYGGGTLGMAYVNTICSASFSGGINVFQGTQSLAFISTVVAHELGHNLGMNHDSALCQCDGPSCIMSAGAGGRTNFSSCSADSFEALIFKGGGMCLKNPSTHSVGLAQCGNGLLEDKEQCDCGTPEECTNVCCDAATCSFSAGSSCADGLCCNNCKVKVAGTSCRASVNSCDVPEFCLGNSGFCPEDFYVMDGLSCEDESAHCYEGRCQTYNYQCKTLFTQPTATKADDKCYLHANVKGNRFGNCGLADSRYTKCTVANIMCGKLQCTNLDANRPPVGGATLAVVVIEGKKCVNADFDLGPDVACLDFSCVNSSALLPASDCDARATCNGHGVCNNLGHCHCDNGWGPPFCDRSGRGGSQDSGPAEIDFSLRNGLLIFFLLVVPVLVLVTLLLLFVFRRESMTGCVQRRKPGASDRLRYGELDYWNDAVDAPGPVPQAGLQSVPRPAPPQGPGSTLARTVSARAAGRGWRSTVMHYDALIPQHAFHRKVLEDNTQQTEWKLYRQSLLQCIESFLRNPDVVSDPPDPGRINAEAWRRCIHTLLEPYPQGESSPILLLLDDNFYYPSMRYEVHQLARKYSLGFCQVFLDCSVESCSSRNQERPHPLPDDLILEMAKRLEPPNPQKNAWEKNSLTLNNSESVSETDLQRWMELLTHAFHHPLVQMQEENTEQKEADRLRCAISVVHQADQACRRLVSAAMKSARDDDVPPERMQCLASELNESKGRFLQDLRARYVQQLSTVEGEDIDVQRVVTAAVAAFDRQIKDTVRTL